MFDGQPARSAFSDRPTGDPNPTAGIDPISYLLMFKDAMCYVLHWLLLGIGDALVGCVYWLVEWCKWIAHEHYKLAVSVAETQVWLKDSLGSFSAGWIESIFGKMRPSASAWQWLTGPLTKSTLDVAEFTIRGLIAPIIASLQGTLLGIKGLASILTTAREHAVRTANEVSASIYRTASQAWDNAETLRARANELTAWTNHGWIGAGILKDDVLYWTVRTWAGPLLAAVVNPSIASDDPLRDSQVIADKMPLRTEAELLAILSGPDASKGDAYQAALSRLYGLGGA